MIFTEGRLIIYLINRYSFEDPLAFGHAFHIRHHSLCNV